VKSELKIEVIVDFFIYYTVDIILMVCKEIDLLAFAYELVIKFFCFLEVDKISFHVFSDGWGLASEG